MGTAIEIRSFRSVFALERRVYRIDTLRLNPGGVPLRGIAYAAALVVASLAAGALPPTSWLDPVVPWYVRDLGVPLAGAGLFGAMRVDGRPVHLAVVALLRHLGGSASGGPRCSRPPVRWLPPPVILIPDGSDARFRALRYYGPGAVLVSRDHLRAEWTGLRSAQLTLHPLGASSASPTASPTALELAAGAVLEVRTR